MEATMCPIIWTVPSFKSSVAIKDDVVAFGEIRDDMIAVWVFVSVIEDAEHSCSFVLRSRFVSERRV